MKVAIIGYGNVGMAVFHALVRMPEIHELALCGRNVARVRGELADFRDCMAINNEIKTRLTGGGYDKTAGADIIIFAAGPAVKDANQSRREIVDQNIKVTKQICEELNKYNREAMIIAISNPLDIIVSAIAKYTGRPREKVIGTGTLLDSARLSRQIADILEIQPSNVNACVLGEHGDSSCIIWSALRIMGLTVDQFVSNEVCDVLKIDKEKINQLNHKAGYKIIEGKGHTAYGVAAATARITSAIIHDTHEILPVSVCLDGEFGIAPGVAISVPCYISRNGATIISHINFSDEEMASIRASAETVRKLKDGSIL